MLLKINQSFWWSFQRLPQLQLHLQASCTFQNKIKCKAKIFFRVTFNDLETSQNLWYGRFQFQHCELLTCERKEQDSLFGIKFDPNFELQKKNLPRKKFKKCSYVIHFKLRGYTSINTWNIDVFYLETAKQIDRNAQLQSVTAISLLDVQNVYSLPLIVSPGMIKNSCCSSILKQ